MTLETVHIVDDDEAIRDALMWLFRTRGVATRSWSSAEEFLLASRDVLSGCVVLDIRMEGMSGLELFDRLRAQDFDLPVLFLTGHADVPAAVAALKKGAFDFVEKPFNDNDLVDRVVAALEHGARQRASANEKATLAGRLGNLSPRERQVMDLMLAGKMNKVIAGELGITMRTVEVHRARVFEKMGVKTAVELAQLLASLRT